MSELKRIYEGLHTVAEALRAKREAPLACRQIRQRNVR